MNTRIQLRIHAQSKYVEYEFLNSSTLGTSWLGFLTNADRGWATTSAGWDARPDAALSADSVAEFAPHQHDDRTKYSFPG